MLEQPGQILLAIVTAALAALHPWAAAGASFGCVFYVMMPAVMEGWQKSGYTFASLGVGYAIGLYYDLQPARRPGENSFL